MKKSAFAVLALMLVGSLAPQQTRTLARGDRPVFYSAKELADDCQKLLKVFPGGEPMDDKKKPTAYQRRNSSELLHARHVFPV
jgi:hypothetical protein